MTLLYTSSQFLHHDTGTHPECARRLEDVSTNLLQHNWLSKVILPEWQPAELSDLETIHTPQYLRHLQQFAETGGGRIEVDTVVSQRSFEVARLGAGAVADAVNRVLHAETKEAQTALCLVRPPGHHALVHAPMGFCLINNVALGARLAIDLHGLERVLIVDWDVHHGNGTQALFWTDPQVGFMSIHRFPFYPGTGDRTETGSGDGLGTTLNIPLPFGVSRADFRSAFAAGLEAISSQMQPQLILLSAGFDAHAADPVGNLGLEVEDFAQLTDDVMAVCDQYTQGRLVSVLEGGYNPPVLAESVAAHLQRLRC